jgi:hypothetical protein
MTDSNVPLSVFLAPQDVLSAFGTDAGAGFLQIEEEIFILD